jgi:amino acid transporter
MKEIILQIKNKQRTTARTFVFLTVVSAIVMILPFLDGNPLSRIWALAFLGIFFTLFFFIMIFVFARRAKKMDKLQTGEKLLVHLELNDEMQKLYATTLRNESKAKNKAIMWVIGILFVVITIPFLFFLEKDEIGGFLAIIGIVVLLIFSASRFFPEYYYRQNLKGDKQILVGEKYAYFNGYFHNWDYPLSGLSKVKAIKTPFHGIYLAYYYTDRTWRHVHEIKFPIPDSFDPEPLIKQLRSTNRK